MAELKGTKTYESLKAAFAAEAQGNRRDLYFAKVADVEGKPEIAALFRDAAESETGYAHGHLDFLKKVGDPVSGEPIGRTDANLKAVIASATDGHTDMYPGFAKIARAEGFDDIADWFDTLARAKRSHAGRFQKGLDSLS
ncbi:rubrerythrin family protein [Streptomyces sp. NPDC057199]|uniref:rubrerythrin family protein n=1 Tax=Streptomyces sp. NPDC057199 TaxID=3346047 RepID=UPI003644E537